MRALRILLVLELACQLVALVGHDHKGILRGDPLRASAVCVVGFCLPLASTWIRGARWRPDGILSLLLLVWATASGMLLHHGYLDLGSSPFWRGSEEGVWSLVALQFAPAVYVAWFRGTRDTMIFTLLAAAMDFAIAWMVREPPAQPVSGYLRALLWRTAFLGVANGFVSLLFLKLRIANHVLARHAASVERLAESRERERLSRELHDTLSHSLSAVAVQLEAVHSTLSTQPERAQRLLEESLRTVREGLSESRRAIRGLKASPLDGGDLAFATRHLVERTRSRTAAEIDLRIDGEFADLTDSVTQCFFRIAQEAMENAVRHSDATAISMEIQRMSHGLRLEVRDNGKGFDPAAPSEKSGFGIQGMRERADLIQAEFAIRAGIGKGCRIQVEWIPSRFQESCA